MPGPASLISYATSERAAGPRLSKLAIASPVFALLAFPMFWIERVMHWVERPGVLSQVGTSESTIAAPALFVPVLGGLLVSAVARYRTRGGQQRLRGSLAADVGIFIGALSFAFCCRACWLILQGMH